MTDTHAQHLYALLAQLDATTTPCKRAPESRPCDVPETIHLLLYSMLMWESTPTAAQQALACLYASFVDLNEMRIAYAHELAETCFDRDRYALERAERLCVVLNNIYIRQHQVEIDHLAECPKREVREYLESLEGMPGFVAARVTLLGFGGHAIGCDALLAEKLKAAGAVDPTLDAQHIGRWLERRLKAGEACKAVLLLERLREASSLLACDASHPPNQTDAAPPASEN